MRFDGVSCIEGLIIILGTFNIFSITFSCCCCCLASSAKFHVFFPQRSIAQDRKLHRSMGVLEIVLLRVIGCSFVIVLIESCCGSASRREKTVVFSTKGCNFEFS